MIKTALVLVDIQNDYFPGGRHPLHNPEPAAEKAGDALRLFRENGWPIFHVRHVNTNVNATFFLPDTDGIRFYQPLMPRTNEPVVVKHRPDSFYNTDLEEHLAAHGVRRLVICGMMTHMCVDTTVRSAKGRDYDVILPHDACATRDLAWDNAVIPARTVQGAYMSALQGAFAEVVPTRILETALNR